MPSFILNIVLINRYHGNKQIDTDAFDLQEVKQAGHTFYVSAFYVFNLSSLNSHLFDFRHYKCKSFEIYSSYSQIFAMKTVHNTTK